MSHYERRNSPQEPLLVFTDFMSSSFIFAVDLEPDFNAFARKLIVLLNFIKVFYRFKGKLDASQKPSNV